MEPTYEGVNTLVNDLLNEAGPERTATYVLAHLQEHGIVTLRDICTALHINEHELYAVIHLLDQQDKLTHYVMIDGEMKEVV